MKGKASAVIHYVIDRCFSEEGPLGCATSSQSHLANDPKIFVARHTTNITMTQGHVTHSFVEAKPGGYSK